MWRLIKGTFMKVMKVNCPVISTDISIILSSFWAMSLLSYLLRRCLIFRQMDNILRKPFGCHPSLYFTTVRGHEDHMGFGTYNIAFGAVHLEHIIELWDQIFETINRALGPPTGFRTRGCDQVVGPCSEEEEGARLWGCTPRTELLHQWESVIKEGWKCQRERDTHALCVGVMFVCFLLCFVHY